MKVCLVGNQNSGKTTLFNLLTGNNQKVGNWPGVTIEKKEGKIKSTDITLVDLPGIYSLSAYTSEEEVSLKYLKEERPDLIINIIDASNIERSLYLTTQLQELNLNMILVFNMTDVLKKKKIDINIDKISNLLNLTIVEISALKRTGITNLIDTIKNEDYIKNSKIKIYDSKIEKILSEIDNTDRFNAVKIFEKDERYTSYLTEELNKKLDVIEKDYGIDTEELIASQRYDFIVNLKNETYTKEHTGPTITDKLDKVFLNKWASIPIFVLIMFLVYFLSVGLVGTFTVDLVDGW
ncbi:MAG: FeoB small GTPase domain-containing protein, partial [Anaeroplasmataceae bacterium]